MKKFAFTYRLLSKHYFIAKDFEEALKMFKKEISDNTEIIVDIDIEEQVEDPVRAVKTDI